MVNLSKRFTKVLQVRQSKDDAMPKPAMTIEMADSASAPSVAAVVDDMRLEAIVDA